MAEGTVPRATIHLPCSLFIVFPFDLALLSFSLMLLMPIDPCIDIRDHFLCLVPATSRVSELESFECYILSVVQNVSDSSYIVYNIILHATGTLSNHIHKSRWSAQTSLCHPQHQALKSQQNDLLYQSGDFTQKEKV